jgi:intracellular septation protein A
MAIRPRVSISFALLTVLLIGMGLAALTHPTELWDSLLVTGSLTLLLIAIVCAILRRRHKRAFWAAFAIFGWGYVVLSCGPWTSTTIKPRLLTDNLLALL